jgi:orotidine-5'-phosphate decarboxylase
MSCIPRGVFTIADAKRGDIGNTSSLYAKAFFEYFHFDAITVAPYMGEDSVKPFLEFKNKWVILLALTSNQGASDFQVLTVDSGTGNKKLFEMVIEKSKEWGNAGNMMYVTGATRADHLKHIRKLLPDHFLLVPGIGAQGGSLEEVSLNGLNAQCGLLVNSSRQILYASSGKDFASAARTEAHLVQHEMEKHLKNKGLLT